LVDIAKNKNYNATHQFFLNDHPTESHRTHDGPS
jgi:hypothetical protein